MLPPVMLWRMSRGFGPVAFKIMMPTWYYILPRLSNTYLERIWYHIIYHDIISKNQVSNNECKQCKSLLPPIIKNACDLHTRVVSREVSQITHHIDEAHPRKTMEWIQRTWSITRKIFMDLMSFFCCTLYHSWRCRDALPAGLLEVVRV